YVNFFVINLLTTPGGVEAMGASTSTNWTLVAIAGVVTVLLWLLIQRVPLEKLAPKRFKPRYFYSLLVAIMLSQSAWYAWADYSYDRRVLQVADRIIWYVPVTAKGFLEQIGVPLQRPDDFYDMSAGGGDL